MIDRVFVCVAVAGGAATSSSSRLLFAFSSFLGVRVGPQSARHLRRLEPSSFVLRSGSAVDGWFLAPFWIG